MSKEEEEINSRLQAAAEAECSKWLSSATAPDSLGIGIAFQLGFLTGAKWQKEETTALIGKLGEILLSELNKQKNIVYGVKQDD